MTSREFKQDAEWAAHGPRRTARSSITDRGTPARVLLSTEDYRRLAAPQNNVADMLACPESPDFDFEPPHLEGALFRTGKF